MVPAVVQHHEEGQRCLGYKGTPANWLPASEEPHLPGPDAQEAKGDGAMGRAHKQAARARRVIDSRVNVRDQRLLSHQHHEPSHELQQEETAVVSHGSDRGWTVGKVSNWPGCPKGTPHPAIASTARLVTT